MLQDNAVYCVPLPELLIPQVYSLLPDAVYCVPLPELLIYLASSY